MAEFLVAAPGSRGEIVQQLKQLQAQSIQFYAGLNTAIFLAPQGAAWSPADHVRHLTKAIRAVNRGLRLPRLVLWWKFGRAQRESRSYDAVMAAYRARLETFDGRGNPFAPSAMQALPDTEAWRAQIMNFHEVAQAELQRNTMRWSEHALDRYQAPHPLLGMLTIRELLYFTLYHNLHHLRLIAGRLEAADSSIS